MDVLKPRFFLAGHIHSLQAEFCGGTWVVNVGYGVNEEFAVIDFDKERIELYEEGYRRLETVPFSKPSAVAPK